MNQGYFDLLLLLLRSLEDTLTIIYGLQEELIIK